MKIGLLNCGGTITENYQSDGTITRLLARDLIVSSGQADWIGHDIDPVDSCDLTFASLCRARDVMRQDRESDAFVLCCGTDAMEDVAYAAALLFDRDRPVVLTGAAIPGCDSSAATSFSNSSTSWCTRCGGRSSVKSFTATSRSRSGS